MSNNGKSHFAEEEQMSSSEQRISSVRMANSPIVRDAYKKAASAVFTLLIVAYAFMLAVSALLCGIDAGGITQAITPAILITILLYSTVPSVATSNSVDAIVVER